MKRQGKKFMARVSVKGQWVYLGLFATEWEACRVAAKARERKRRGEPVLPSRRSAA